jgi:hypothetical protein
MLNRLRGLVGPSDPGRLHVELPPEEFDAALAADGIVEAAPAGVGRRQFWLAQMVSAIRPDHWEDRFGIGPDGIVRAAASCELSSALLDGFVTAALRHHATGWFAPLYDAMAVSDASPRLTPQPFRALAVRLSPADAEPRMNALLDAGKVDLLPAFGRPWGRSVSERIVAGLERWQPEWASLVSAAALAIPVEYLPSKVDVPGFTDDDYAVRAYLRALDQFQTIAGARRAIAQEIPL